MKRCLPILLFLAAGCTFSQEPETKAAPAGAPGSTAEIDETVAALRKSIVDGVAAGTRPTVELDLLGSRARVQVIKADDKGLSVKMESTDLPVRWSEISADRLGTLATAFAKTGADYVNLARFYALNKMATRAEKA